MSAGRARTLVLLLVLPVLVLTGVLGQGAPTTARVPATPAIQEAADTSLFNPGNIISNEIFFDGNAMGAGEIQSFLEVKGSSCRPGSDGTPCLRNYVQDTTDRAADAFCAGYTGAPQERASTIIARVAMSCGISPKVLLVILQKEQSLVTNNGSSLYAMRYQKAMGFACPDTAACDTAYYGFQNQVYAAARQFKRYAANPNGFNYRAGRTNTILYNPKSACGSSQVYIQNQATAGLYVYTPYQPNSAALAAGYNAGDGCSAYGNRNFWLYFTDWFGSTQVPGVSTTLPIGSLDGGSSSFGVVSIGGWAMDPDDPRVPLQVHVYVDGTFAGVTTADESRPDVAAARPGTGDLHGYHFSVTTGLGVRQVCAYAINIGAGTINPQLGCTAIDNQDAGAPKGSADTVVGVPGSIGVGGWAYDPDAPNSPIDVHAYVDGRFAGRIVAGDPRADVGAAFGIGPLHGFNGSFAAATGAHDVCLYAINVGPGSVNTPISCRSVTVPDPRAYDPNGVLDGVQVGGGTVRLGGWVVDADLPTGQLPVHVYVDGSFAGVTYTGIARPDVERSVAGAGPATGYSWTGTVSAGDHQVCAYAINVGYGTRNVPLGCRTIRATDGVAASPTGNVDGVSGGDGTVTAVGWAADPDLYGDAVSVHAYVDGTFAAAFPANGSRPDVGRVLGPQQGDLHGFSWTGTATPGRHQVCLYAINAGPGTTNTPLGCGTATTTDPSAAFDPRGSLDAVNGQAGTLTAGGWVLDPDILSSPAEVHVYVDGAWTASVRGGDRRPDIAAAYPGAGEGHGFNWRGSASPGPHQVCVYAINTGQGTVNTPLGCRTAVVQ